MENDFFGDLNEFEGTTSKVAEKTKGLRNLFLCFKFKINYGKQLKDKLNECLHDFPKALNCDLSDNGDIDRFFSKKVGVLLCEIKEKNSVEFLTQKQIVLLFVDFIVPVAYRTTGINHIVLFYDWIIHACRNIWYDMPLPIKEALYNICYRGETYREIELDEEEKIINELEKYPEIGPIVRIGLTREENFVRILKFKNEIPNNIYAYCAKQIYICDSFGVTNETLHAVFDGLSKEELMSNAEMRIYENLPNRITIFRGTDANEVIPRISWTLDISIAKKYNSGQLFSAIISKEKIMACFDTDEKEVLVWLTPDEIKRL
ncbi:MAG: hypothetical protein K0S01_3248 [Herbinix sp.]|jgi:hypothetical protein|nr:hypothetical protein [Herbinix sp.]